MNHVAPDIYAALRPLFGVSPQSLEPAVPTLTRSKPTRIAPAGRIPAAGTVREASMRSGLYMASGPRVLPSWFLQALCPLLASGQRIFWIDAGNRFDAYGLGRTARSQGFPPKAVLSRVSLARPFNPFQLETIIRQKLPSVWRGEPIVLSDPLRTFGDGDLPLEERLRMFPRVLAAVMEFPALWLILNVDRDVLEGGERTWESFLGQADGSARLERDERTETWRLLPKSHGTNGRALKGNNERPSPRNGEAK